jgi:cardiolipin synthase A/B
MACSLRGRPAMTGATGRSTPGLWRADRVSGRPSARPWGMADRVADAFDRYQLPRTARTATGFGCLSSGRQYISAAARGDWRGAPVRYPPGNLPLRRRRRPAVRCWRHSPRRRDRGVEVRLLVDGFGSGEFARRSVRRLPPGMRRRCASIVPSAGGGRGQRLLRRLHRKIAVDRRSGLRSWAASMWTTNRSRDELTGEPIGPRFDFAVSLRGADRRRGIALAVRRLWWAVGVACLGQNWSSRRHAGCAPRCRWHGGVRASLVLRDNLRHRHSIEHSYLSAIRSARQQILIACAYFLPGQRLPARIGARGAARRARPACCCRGAWNIACSTTPSAPFTANCSRRASKSTNTAAATCTPRSPSSTTEWATVGIEQHRPAQPVARPRGQCRGARPRVLCRQLRAAIEAAVAHDSRRLDAHVDYGRRSWIRASTDWIAYGLVRAAAVVLARGNDY